MRYLIYGQQGINDEVIDHYLNIIAKAYGIAKHQELIRVNTIEDIDDGDFVLLYTIADAFRVRLKKKINFAIWMQGVYPEERQLRGKTKIDYIVMSWIEKKVLNNAEKIFMVSNAMLEHYEKKYNIALKEKTFLMPCYNCALNKEAFFSDHKYDEPSFVYVGSLANWQCFDKTVYLFAKIKKSIPNAKLYVYTKEQEQAEKIIKDAGIENYHLGFVNTSELGKEISRFKYGFIIRDDIVVNNVASPTKLSNYIGSGLIPIVSDCISLYEEISKDSQYFILGHSENDFIQKIESMEKQKLSADKIYNEYKRLFKKYYDDEEYIKLINNFLM